MSDQRTAILRRIAALEKSIAKANEYLATGHPADFPGFRPLFTPKLKAGKPLPPHPAWVRNAYLPQQQRALAQAEKKLARVETQLNTRP